MLFNSYLFILAFLPISVAGYWLIARTGTARLVWLVAAGIIFYGVAGFGPLALLLVIGTLVYGSARYLLSSAQPRNRNVGLVVALSSLANLIVFKYLGTATLQVMQIVLPLGISFYTFNLLGYSFDVYRRVIPAETSYLKFLSYATFFPTVASGPLMRYGEFRNQRIDSAPDASNFASGLFQFSIGLAKKLIVADYLGIVVNALFGNHGQLGMIGAWAAALAYSYQIYFDFSGYSDMAIGIGQLLGFRIPQNFNAPYAASTITEFWQRWHITLSNWFRYYVFTPLSRVLIRLEGNRRPEMLRTISLISTMALVGLWHGAGWTFVLWGVYHGVMLAIHAQVRRQTDMPSAWRLIIYRLFTFLLVVVGWVLFRSPTLQAALGLYGAMIGLRGLGIQDLRFVPNLGGLELLLVIGVVFVISNLFDGKVEPSPRLNWGQIVGVSFLLTLCLLMLANPSPFLYFQF